MKLTKEELAEWEKELLPPQEYRNPPLYMTMEVILHCWRCNELNYDNKGRNCHDCRKELLEIKNKESDKKFRYQMEKKYEKKN